MSGTLLDRLHADASAVRAVIKRRRASLLAIGLVALTGTALAQRWGGLNPYSLWLDDQWVVALVKHASLNDLVELGPRPPSGSCSCSRRSIRWVVRGRGGCSCCRSCWAWRRFHFSVGSPSA